MSRFGLFILVLFSFSSSFSQVPSYVPANGLVGWWPFNGNANDASGNNNNGTLTGGQYSTGRGGLTNTALLFNSSAAGYVDVNLANSISGQFSLMMWIRADRSSTYVGESTVCPGGVSVPMANSNQNWAMIPGNGGSNLGVGLSFVQNGIMVGEHANNILVSRLSHSNNSTTFNQIIIVYRTDSTFLYLNGLKVRSRAIYCSTNNKFIGPSIRFGGSLYSPNFAGIIDDIGIWNRALSQQEINGLYNSIDPFSISATNSTVCSGQPTTLSVQSISGTITALNCTSATNTGTLTSGTAASGVSSSVPYTGGNGGTHNGQTVASSGVSGLTATLTSGTFASGNGSLTYTITGTPASGGTASFALNIGGQTCTLTRTINYAYPAGTVHCNGTPTAVIIVTNPTTGKQWMDRNLGASQVATSSTDAAAYGDLYQWGRRADGHQCRTSPTTATLSNTDQPGNGNFILSNLNPPDWRSPKNDNLWQGVNGINNPCPIGFRLPTESEIDSERASWSTNDFIGAFNSPLKLSMGGDRYASNGGLSIVGQIGIYSTSTIASAQSRYLYFFSGAAYMNSYHRGHGLSLRCIKN